MCIQTTGDAWECNEMEKKITLLKNVHQIPIL